MIFTPLFEILSYNIYILADVKNNCSTNFNELFSKYLYKVTIHIGDHNVGAGGHPFECPPAPTLLAPYRV